LDYVKYWTFLLFLQFAGIHVQATSTKMGGKQCAVFINSVCICYNRNQYSLYYQSNYNMGRFYGRYFLVMEIFAPPDHSYLWLPGYFIACGFCIWAIPLFLEI